MTQPAQVNSAQTDRVCAEQIDLNEYVDQLMPFAHYRLRHPLVIRPSAADADYRTHKACDTIPIDPTRYRESFFNIGGSPQCREAQHVLWNLECGYRLTSEFRLVCPVSFVLLAANGNVLEIGFQREEQKEIFLRHLCGVAVTDVDRARLMEIQASLFTYIRANPQAQQLLEEFGVVQRGWHPNLVNIGRLAYYDEKLTPIRPYAASQGYSLMELHQAGWLKISFGASGNLRFVANRYPVIRTPHFTDEGHIPCWRTRNLAPHLIQKAKYLSFPRDRSLNWRPHVCEKMFNSWGLSAARDSLLVITEGEYKALTLHHMAGIPTVAILGITQVDLEMLQTIIAAKPQKIVIILDRDARAKGVLRTDGITDSERAMYSIATQLIALGHPCVQIGMIPDTNEGHKVGADDLYLKNGIDALNDVIAKAVSPEKFAEIVGLDTSLQDRRNETQRFRRVFLDVLQSVRRGGEKPDSTMLLGARKKLREREKSIDANTAEQYSGRKRLDHPYHKLQSIPATHAIPNIANKSIMTATGESLSPELFCGEIALIDLKIREIETNAPFPPDTSSITALRFPFTLQSLRESHKKSSNPDVLKAFGYGLKAIGHDLALSLRREDSSFGQLSRTTLNLKQFSLVVFAGHLSYLFPADEYDIRYGIRLTKVNNAAERSFEIPLTIMKRDSQRVVAFAAVTFAQLPMPREVAKANRSDLTPSRNLHGVHRFLRRQPGKAHKRSTNDLFETLTKLGSVDQAKTSLRTLGICRETVEKCRMVQINASAWESLAGVLKYEGFLKLAVQKGLLKAHNGAIEPLVTTDALVIAVTAADCVIDFRILPLHESKLETYRYSTARSKATACSQHITAWAHLSSLPAPLFFETLRDCAGNDLVITLDSLDGLLMSAAHPHILIANGNILQSKDVMTAIVDAAPARIIFLLNSRRVHSVYDSMDTADHVPGVLKELYDFSEDLKLRGCEIPVCFAAMFRPLAEQSAELIASLVSEIREHAREVRSYLAQCTKFSGEHHEAEVQLKNCAYDLATIALKCVGSGKKLSEPEAKAWYRRIKAQRQLAAGSAELAFGMRQSLGDFGVSGLLGLRHICSPKRVVTALKNGEFASLLSTDSQTVARQPQQLPALGVPVATLAERQKDGRRHRDTRVNDLDPLVVAGPPNVWLEPPPSFDSNAELPPAESLRMNADTASGRRLSEWHSRYPVQLGPVKALQEADGKVGALAVTFLSQEVTARQHTSGDEALVELRRQVRHAALKLKTAMRWWKDLTSLDAPSGFLSELQRNFSKHVGTPVLTSESCDEGISMTIRVPVGDGEVSLRRSAPFDFAARYLCQRDIIPEALEALKARLALGSDPHPEVPAAPIIAELPPSPSAEFDLPSKEYEARCKNAGYRRKIDILAARNKWKVTYRNLHTRDSKWIWGCVTVKSLDGQTIAEGGPLYGRSKERVQHILAADIFKSLRSKSEQVDYLKRKNYETFFLRLHTKGLASKPAEIKASEGKTWSCSVSLTLDNGFQITSDIKNGKDPQKVLKEAYESAYSIFCSGLKGGLISEAVTDTIYL